MKHITAKPRTLWYKRWDKEPEVWYNAEIDEVTISLSTAPMPNGWVYIGRL